MYESHPLSLPRSAAGPSPVLGFRLGGAFYSLISTILGILSSEILPSWSRSLRMPERPFSTPPTYHSFAHHRESTYDVRLRRTLWADDVASPPPSSRGVRQLPDDVAISTVRVSGFLPLSWPAEAGQIPSSPRLLCHPRAHSVIPAQAGIHGLLQSHHKGPATAYWILQ